MLKKPGIHIISGFPGKEFSREIKYLIEHIKVGGFIFFKHNVENPIQVAHLCTLMQTHALRTLQRPLVLAIDQEGGRVQRLPEPFTQIPSPTDMARLGTEIVIKYAQITAQEMKLVGLNLNLAPVADISPTDPPQFLASRTYGDDPGTVTRSVLEVIRSFKKENIIPTVKHFPGLGKATLDPHETLPIINRSLHDLESWELIPFRKAFSEGAECVMTSHAVYRWLDEKLPATLSEKILVGVLRKKMGFGGIAITDDLEMGAISKFGDLPTIVKYAWKAQNDFFLICHDLNMVDTFFEILCGQSSDKAFRDYHAASKIRIETLLKKIPKDHLIIDLKDVKNYFSYEL